MKRRHQRPLELQHTEPSVDSRMARELARLRQPDRELGDLAAVIERGYAASKPAARMPENRVRVERNRQGGPRAARQWAWEVSVTDLAAIVGAPAEAIDRAVAQLCAVNELHAASDLRRAQAAFGKTIKRILERHRKTRATAEAVVDKRCVVLLVTLPIRTVSESNQREHWAKKHRSRGDIRPCVEMAMRANANARRIKLVAPCLIRIVRVSPGPELDDDNLRGATKAVRDGVADAFGKDDSARSGLTFDYGQAAGRHFAIRIELRTVPA